MEAILLFGLGMGLALAEGFTASHLYRLFIIPLGFPFIGVIQASGIMLLVMMFAKTPDASISNEELVKKAFNRVALLIAFFAMGYSLHLFMVK